MPLTPYQTTNIQAIPDADLRAACVTAIRLANRCPKDALNLAWRDRLYLECCCRGLEAVCDAALVVVQAENREHRKQNQEAAK